jgi:hypothetical protein
MNMGSKVSKCLMSPAVGAQGHGWWQLQLVKPQCQAGGVAQAVTPGFFSH